MADWGLIAVRFTLYVDLMLLVGLAAFPLYSLASAEREASAIPSFGRLLGWLVVAGLILSVLGFAVTSAAMMGVAIDAFDAAMLVSMATDTEMGAAWCVRIVALIGVLLGVFGFRRRQTPLLVWTLAGGVVALSTLVWSGHAGASEGSLGVAHRIGDIAHMVAGALWIGGIAAFALLLSPRAGTQDDDDVAVIARALANFSRVGTAAVAIIVLTGLFNGFVILGTEFSTLFQSTYGWLLMAKIALVGVMLLLAANNRWKLTPALERSPVGADRERALVRLRWSIALEALAGSAVLALVAWLGTLPPAPAS